MRCYEVLIASVAILATTATNPGTINTGIRGPVFDGSNQGNPFQLNIDSRFVGRSELSDYNRGQRDMSTTCGFQPCENDERLRNFNTETDNQQRSDTTDVSTNIFNNQRKQANRRIDGYPSNDNARNNFVQDRAQNNDQISKWNPEYQPQYPGFSNSADYSKESKMKEYSQYQKNVFLNSEPATLPYSMPQSYVPWNGNTLNTDFNYGNNIEGNYPEFQNNNVPQMANGYVEGHLDNQYSTFYEEKVQSDVPQKVNSNTASGVLHIITYPFPPESNWPNRTPLYQFPYSNNNGNNLNSQSNDTPSNRYLSALNNMVASGSSKPFFDYVKQGLSSFTTSLEKFGNLVSNEIQTKPTHQIPTSVMLPVGVYNNTYNSGPVPPNEITSQKVGTLMNANQLDYIKNFRNGYFNGEMENSDYQNTESSGLNRNIYPFSGYISNLYKVNNQPKYPELLGDSRFMTDSENRANPKLFQHSIANDQYPNGGTPPRSSNLMGGSEINYQEYQPKSKNMRRNEVVPTYLGTEQFPDVALLQPTASVNRIQPYNLGYNENQNIDINHMSQSHNLNGGTFRSAQLNRFAQPELNNEIYYQGQLSRNKGINGNEKLPTEGSNQAYGLFSMKEVNSGDTLGQPAYKQLPVTGFPSYQDQYPSLRDKTELLNNQFTSTVMDQVSANMVTNGATAADLPKGVLDRRIPKKMFENQIFYETGRKTMKHESFLQEESRAKSSENLLPSSDLQLGNNNGRNCLEGSSSPSLQNKVLLKLLPSLRIEARHIDQLATPEVELGNGNHEMEKESSEDGSDLSLTKVYQGSAYSQSIVPPNKTASIELLNPDSLNNRRRFDKHLNATPKAKTGQVSFTGEYTPEKVNQGLLESVSTKKRHKIPENRKIRSKPERINYILIPSSLLTSVSTAESINVAVQKAGHRQLKQKHRKFKRGEEIPFGLRMESFYSNEIYGKNKRNRWEHSLDNQKNIHGSRPFHYNVIGSK